MFPINRSQLDQEAAKSGAKQQPVRNNSLVFDAVKLTFLNLVETISNLATYNAVHWSTNVDRWHKNLSSSNTTTYKRGDIVFLDLGAQNFIHEPSYTHACIVLANKYDSILVVPCSTKQYGTGHPGIIDATPADGFVKNTGVQSFNFRWVSKNRVVSRTGKKVSSQILNQLDAVLVSFAPSIENSIKQKDQLINEQANQIAELQKRIEEVTQKPNKNEDSRE